MPVNVSFHANYHNESSLFESGACVHIKVCEVGEVLVEKRSGKGAQWTRDEAHISIFIQAIRNFGWYEKVRVDLTARMAEP